MAAMTVFDFASMVCEMLPCGWVLSLEMEQGAGDFILYDPAGDRVDPEEYCSVDDRMEKRGFQAMQYAKRQAEVRA